MCRASGDRFDAARWSIAETLGVSQKTVNNARRELRESGKLKAENQFSKSVEKFSPETFSRPEKRRQVRDYIDDNADASNREVADARHIPFIVQCARRFNSRPVGAGLRDGIGVETNVSTGAVRRSV